MQPRKTIARSASQRRAPIRSWGVALGLVGLALSTGCASYFQARDARQAYYACLEDPNRTDEECERERQRADAEFERYEDEAERAWGCENTPDRCRDGSGP